MIRKNPDAFAIGAILLLVPAAWFFSNLRQEVRMTVMPIGNEMRIEGQRLRQEGLRMRQEGMRMRQEQQNMILEQGARIREQRQCIREQLRQALHFRSI